MQQKNSGLHIIEIEITNRCNLNCRHCYVDKNQSKDLDSKKVFDLIGQSRELSVHRLMFTGGEPLLVKDLFKFAQFAQKKESQK